ncbi:MAG: hypothetical protein KBD01_16735 [Acidobacteria bacterium]|nr:hypothetical protein [Acidobacteriota bacterium]
MDLTVLWVVLATIAVTLLAVLTGYIVSTMAALKGTVRELNRLLVELRPGLEDTVEHMRIMSGNVAQASMLVGELGNLAGPVQQGVSRISRVVPLLTGGAALFAAFRAMRSRRDTHRRRKSR